MCIRDRKNGAKTAQKAAENTRKAAKKTAEETKKAAAFVARHPAGVCIAVAALLLFLSLIHISILGDLYDELLKQPEPEAARIAAALELYVSGSLNAVSYTHLLRRVL